MRCLFRVRVGARVGWALALPSVGAGAAPPLYFAGSAKPSRLEPIGTAGPPTSSRAWRRIGLQAGMHGLQAGCVGLQAGVDRLAGWDALTQALALSLSLCLSLCRAGVVRSIRAEASLPPKKNAESRLKPRPA